MGNPRRQEAARPGEPAAGRLCLLSPVPLHSPDLQPRYWVWPFSKVLTVSRAAWALLTR